MTWNKLTKKQQDAARAFAAELFALGITEASTSQCARYLEDCFSWKRGQITLAELCERATWAAPAPKTREVSVKDLATELGVPPSTIYRRIQSDALSAVKSNGRWTITIPA